MEEYVPTDWSVRKELDGSVASTSCSATIASGLLSSPSPPILPSGPTRRVTLEEQGRFLTKQIIQLKFNIAEQKGKQEELNLDWRRLHTEKNACQSELADIDKECDAIRAETEEVREEAKRAQDRLDGITMGRYPERKEMEDVTKEYDAAKAELRGTEEEMEKVKVAGEELRTSIENLKGKASQISSDRARLATESEGVEREVEELWEEIAKMKQSVHEEKSRESQYLAELAGIRKESEKLAKQNEILESKITYREERMAKNQ
mmetsp:Transcript_31001/g.64952  ORF Transcript_31001/g.64952 Transcript_31001/m.64952 type:complete len:263 (+) Transcript_31001:265-1053(+)